MDFLPQHPNLSVIAVRILPGCQSHIRKCLREDVFYYLNNNYEISRQGDSIRRRDGFIQPTDDNFFDLQDGKSSPNINISAIVGKNGDGKSSLIEVIIRLINDFAYCTHLDPNGHLTYVDGVCAELYYRFDGDFFVITVRDGKEFRPSVRVYDYKWDKALGSYKRAAKQLTDIEINSHVFYTLVSNYSHFAYNTEEFTAECKYDATDDHWLARAFHKNDAYQTPLNLHPYRDKGNIDINRERLLSTQRLLTSIAGSIKRDESGEITIGARVNDKIPYELRIKDIGYSKLQRYTLKKYFEDNRNSNIIDDHIETLGKFVSEPGETYVNELIIYDIIGSSLSALSDDYISGSFLNFLREAIAWIDRQGLLNKKSDLQQLIHNIGRTYEDRGPYRWKKILSVWKGIAPLSAVQFLRLALVYDICRMWNRIGVGDNENIRLAFDPTAIFKPYDSLSIAEKCCHYIIYKTIMVFSTYPSYSGAIKGYTSPDTIFNYRSDSSCHNTLCNLNDAFAKLSTDWHRKSHITLKLRQTFSMLLRRKATRGLYTSLHKTNGKSIVFENLSDRQISTLSDIECLPPPIFNWEIFYRRKGRQEPISFNAFSSGEKQNLFFRSAIVYHLRNINSIGEEKIHYHSVNLVFEEIELYFHPEWQRTLIFELMKSIRSANIPNIYSVNMIFVTHSPYILSDIPKSNVLFLKDGMPVYEMQENTFGANINSLLKNGFFLPSLPIGEFANTKINTLFGKLHSGDVTPQSLPQLYAQIMTVGEPAIRMQLMTLLAPYRRLFLV